MLSKEDLQTKRTDLAVQLQEAMQGIEVAKAQANQVRGAIIALDALIAEYDRPAEPVKPRKKGKKS